jgi:carboxypeptidase family protein
MNHELKQRVRRSAALAALIAMASSSAVAQDAKPARGSVTGIVFDSLITNAPLAGAEVVIEGTEQTAITDVRGQFRIDGVPVGRAALRFYHASLDSLGFGAAPAVVRVGESGTVTVALATPSPATLHAHLCPAPQPRSTGVLLGRVRDVDARTPVSNADVTVRWSEWTLGLGALNRSERVVTANSDSSGAYTLCGVPADVAVVARATAAGHVTGLVEVDFATRLFGTRDFAVSLRDSAARAGVLAQLDSLITRGDSVSMGGSASIGGTIRAPDGGPIAGAQVALFGFPVTVRTNGDGAFRLTAIAAGSQTVEVRAVGYAPKRTTVELATGERRTIDIPLLRAAQTLASVNIVGRGSRIDMTGFDERRTTGLGHFIGPEEIERRRVFDTSQLLWNVAGSRVIWNGSDNVVMFTRPNGTGVGGGGFNTLCNPSVFVDGYQVYDLNDVRPYDVRGIEVYNEQSAAPPAYRAPSLKDSGRPNQHCAVILVWTKPRAPKRSTKR